MRETDEILYRRFLKEGQEQDLRVLLERYREGLTLFLFGYVHSMEDAEELMMDAFATAISGTARFSGKSSFKTWLFAIGRNQALNHLRKHRFRTQPLEEETLRAPDQTDFALLQQEEYRELYRAMEKLNPDYRQVLYLLYFEELTHEEAAVIMKKSRKQIYNLSFRGRQALKETLERMGFDHA